MTVAPTPLHRESHRRARVWIAGAFVLVAIGVLVLRLREPDRHRPFRTPMVWLVAPGAVLSCGYLMLQLPAITWIRFALWLLAGLVIYALYGYRRSRLREG